MGSEEIEMKGAMTVAFMAALLASSCASSGFGVLADGKPYNRVIVVDKPTRWVNVVEGEVIRFVVRPPGAPDASFTWSFDTFGGRVTDLRSLAPHGLVDRRIDVYIAADPRTRGQ